MGFGTFFMMKAQQDTPFYCYSNIDVAGLEIKKIFRSPFGDQPENYSRQMQIFSRQFVKCK